MEVEVEGKTTEDAIEAACRQLGQPREMLEIKVITPGSTGIFGIVGTRKARIKARVKEGAAAAAAPPKAKGRGRGRGRGRAEKAPPPPEEAPEAREPSPEEPPEEEALEGQEPEAKEHRKPRRRRRRHKPAAQAVPPEAEAETPLLAGRPEAEALPAPEEYPELPGPEAARPEPTPRAEEPVASPELVEAARETCERLISELGYEDIEVRAEAQPGECRLELVGEECEALIGRRGEVLNALQHLVSKIANRRAGTLTAVSIDSQGWRGQRRLALEELAAKLARKAKESGRPVSMSPMNAHDRRIVHLALQQDGEITTNSKGEGPLRRLVIIPRKGRRNRRKAQGHEDQND